MWGTFSKLVVMQVGGIRSFGPWVLRGAKRIEVKRSRSPGSRLRPSDVESMVREGVMKDATTVAALGLFKLEGLLQGANHPRRASAFAMLRPRSGSGREVHRSKRMLSRNADDGGRQLGVDPPPGASILVFATPFVGCPRPTDSVWRAQKRGPREKSPGPTKPAFTGRRSRRAGSVARARPVLSARADRSYRDR
jgi:hypothetical protein